MGKDDLLHKIGTLVFSVERKEVNSWKMVKANKKHANNILKFLNIFCDRYAYFFSADQKQSIRHFEEKDIVHVSIIFLKFLDT